MGIVYDAPENLYGRYERTCYIFTCRSPGLNTPLRRLFIVPLQTNLYFIRHGEGMANISERILDQCAGSGLTPCGVQQVQQLQQRLRITGEIQADVIVTSTFL